MEPYTEIWMPSTNRRPRGATLSLVVIHALAEYVIDNNQANYGPYYVESIGLSAHAYITPRGPVIRQVRTKDVAWHAKGWNAQSFGVEFMVPGAHDYESFLARMKEPWVTQHAMRMGVQVLAQILHDYPNVEFTTHEKLDPERKHDPGPMFPMNSMVRQARAEASKYVEPGSD